MAYITMINALIIIFVIFFHGFERVRRHALNKETWFKEEEPKFLGGDPVDDIYANEANQELNQRIPHSIRSFFNCCPNRIILEHIKVREGRFQNMSLSGIKKWKKSAKQLLRQTRRHSHIFNLVMIELFGDNEMRHTYCKIRHNIENWMIFLKNDVRTASDAIRQHRSFKNWQLLDRKWNGLESMPLQQILSLIDSIQ